MKKKNYNFIFIIVLLFIVSISSCVDTWDSHYSSVSEQKSDLNLYAYINSQDTLKDFAKMIKIAGYDTILNQTQTYTVWTPVNSVALKDLLLANDTGRIREVVENHITRFSYTTSGLSAKKVLMLDNKSVVFAGNGTSFTFGGHNLINSKSNIATSNGIVHFIDNYVPYMTSILDYISRTKGLDSLKAYFNSNDKKTFDLAGSGVSIGVDANGQLLYDSVFIPTNKILNRLGSLKVEDSLYTAILPNNAAWTEAYERIKPSFNALPADGGAVKQRKNTQWAIVQDIIFRKQIANPASYDSLVSTTGSVFHQPAYLFDGAAIPASNGLIYVNSLMKHKAADSWQKEIRVEAEYQTFSDATSFQSFDFTARSSYNPLFDISKNGYLYAKNLSTSSLIMPFLKLNIPGTLSAKYNIKCVFAPGSVVDTTDKRPSKVKFYLTYIDNTGKLIVDAPIDANNNVAPTLKSDGKTYTTAAGIFTTNATTMTKMFVTQFQFPFTNLYDEDNRLTYAVAVKLKVESVAPREGAVNIKFNRDLRVDCIILEPVQ